MKLSLAPVALIVLAVCAALGAGCGGGQSDGGEVGSKASLTASTVASEAEAKAPTRKPKPKRPSVEACLRSKGIRFARSVDELAFLKRAEARGDVYPQGYFRDESGDEVVNINTLGKKKINGRPPEWYVWIGSPVLAAGEDAPSPYEVIGSQPPEGFVAYVVRPSPELRQRIKSCFVA